MIFMVQCALNTSKYCKTRLQCNQQRYELIQNSLYCFIDKAVADSGLFTFLATLDLFMYRLPVFSGRTTKRLIKRSSRENARDVNK